MDMHSTAARGIISQRFQGCTSDQAFTTPHIRGAIFSHGWIESSASRNESLSRQYGACQLSGCRTMRLNFIYCLNAYCEEG